MSFHDIILAARLRVNVTAADRDACPERVLRSNW
jgi:hypothetical protein